MKYIGTVLWNLFGTLFALFVLDSAYGMSEVRVTALLLMLMAGLNTGVANLDLNGAKRFLALYKNINRENLDDTDIDEAEALLKKTQTKLWIAAIFNSIVWIASVLAIISNS